MKNAYLDINLDEEIKEINRKLEKFHDINEKMNQIRSREYNNSQSEFNSLTTNFKSCQDAEYFQFRLDELKIEINEKNTLIINLSEKLRYYENLTKSLKNSIDINNKDIANFEKYKIETNLKIKKNEELENEINFLKCELRKKDEKIILDRDQETELQNLIKVTGEKFQLFEDSNSRLLKENEKLIKSVENLEYEIAVFRRNETEIKCQYDLMKTYINEIELENRNQKNEIYNLKDDANYYSRQLSDLESINKKRELEFYKEMESKVNEINELSSTIYNLRVEKRNFDMEFQENQIKLKKNLDDKDRKILDLNENINKYLNEIEIIKSESLKNISIISENEKIISLSNQKILDLNLEINSLQKKISELEKGNLSEIEKFNNKITDLSLKNKDHEKKKEELIKKIDIYSYKYNELNQLLEMKCTQIENEVSKERAARIQSEKNLTDLMKLFNDIDVHHKNDVKSLNKEFLIKENEFIREKRDLIYEIDLLKDLSQVKINQKEKLLLEFSRLNFNFINHENFIKNLYETYRLKNLDDGIIKVKQSISNIETLLNSSY